MSDMTINQIREAKREPRWEMILSLSPPSILPTGLDKTNLIDVTRIGDAFRRYLDQNTGKTHDGAEYHAQMMRDLQME